MTRAEIDDWSDRTEIPLALADGFDHAILGIAQRFNDYFIVYDRAKVIDTLVTRDGMSIEDAEEFFDFNIVGGWVGATTPAYLSVDVDG